MFQFSYFAKTQVLFISFQSSSFLFLYPVPHNTTSFKFQKLNAKFKRHSAVQQEKKNTHKSRCLCCLFLEASTKQTNTQKKKPHDDDDEIKILNNETNEKQNEIPLVQLWSSNMD